MDIGIIGAGPASAAASYLIDTTMPDADITVLEKSGGVCGRAATRRRDGRYYDYGANYLKDDDERVVELVTERLDADGLERIDEPVYVFDETGAVSEGRDADDQKWSYREGLTQLAKRLFAETDASVQHHCRVEQIHRSDDSWSVTDSDGAAWGSFDLLLCNPPAPQTAALLESSDWTGETKQALLDAVSAVTYRSIWTAVFGYEFELDRQYYALVNTDKNHDIGWISREECKPGHVPAGESLLIVQANHDWSVANFERSAASNIDELASTTAEVLDEPRVASPAWTDSQGWRYALPEDGVALGPVRDAEQSGFYCLGDWVAGEARLHAALGNGLETGERIVHQHG